MRYNTDLSDPRPIRCEVLGYPAGAMKRLIWGRVMHRAKVLVEIDIEPRGVGCTSLRSHNAINMLAAGYPLLEGWEECRSSFRLSKHLLSE